MNRGAIFPNSTTAIESAAIESAAIESALAAVSLSEDAEATAAIPPIQSPTLPDKSPVSVLQELCMRQGLAVPRYEGRTAAASAPNFDGTFAPLFEVRVTAKGLQAQAAAPSKKGARRRAAELLLKALQERGVDVKGKVKKTSTLNLSIQENNNETTPTTNKCCAIGNPAGIENPVGWLQEICTSRLWPPPVYELEKAEGPAHDPMYSMVCSVLEYRELGRGRTKKSAKREAAHRVCRAIRDGERQPNEES